MRNLDGRMTGRMDGKEDQHQHHRTDGHHGYYYVGDNAICVHALISKVKNAEATFSILLSLEKFWNIDISIVLKCCKYLYVKTGVHFILFCDHTWTLPIGSVQFWYLQKVLKKKVCSVYVCRFTIFRPTQQTFLYLDWFWVSGYWGEILF